MSNCRSVEIVEGSKDRKKIFEKKLHICSCGNNLFVLILNKNFMKNELLTSKSFDLALEIIDICESLDKMGRIVISNQLLKAGTSIGANIREATYAESKNDFIHKISIARKEAAEREYWLEIIHKKAIIVVSENVKDLLNHIQRIITVLLNSSRK